MQGQKPREIKSELKSKRIVFEEERPLRWPYMKLLREHSDMKQFYPEINPYAEVYQYRENMYAIFTESFDGAGDPWMFLIDGPQKAMLIDTGFGVGDLKGLVRKLVNDKELIVVNTHAHFDHAYGDCQFGKVYCHEAEVPNLQRKNNPHIWDYLFDPETHKPIFTEFDRADIVPFQEFEIIGVPDGYCFDLGEGYLVEAVHLPGHAPGQCGYYDLHNQDIFIGDTNGIGKPFENDPYEDFYTVEALCLALRRLKPRFAQIRGVFPGHGMLDQPNVALQNILNAAEAVLAHPDIYDTVKEVERWGVKRTIYTRNILEGSAIRYSKDQIFMKHNKQ